MTDAQAARAANQRQPQELRLSLNPLQQSRIGEFQVLESGVDIGGAPGVQQSGQSEAFDESFDLARSHRLLFHVDEMNRHAPLFEEPFRSACGLRVLYAEYLDAHHIIRFLQTRVLAVICGTRCDMTAHSFPANAHSGAQRPLALRLLFVGSLMIHTTVVAILLSVSPVALGQTLSFGVVTGTNLTQDFRIPSWSRSTPGSRGVIAGPAIEIALPGSLWVELNALHRSLPYNYEVLIFGGSQFALKVNVDTWEFPLLVKYRFPIFNGRPFIELGPSFRTAHNKSGTEPSNYGITGGAGVEMH